MSLKEQVRLYGITMPMESMEQQVQAALVGGVTILQIRQKNCTTEELVQLAQPILQLCRTAHVPCIINDDVEAARMLQADGVHIGQGDMPIAKAREILGDCAIIGTSAHNVQEALTAQQQGADYIGCGAVFQTGTKTDATALSMEELKKILASVEIPVVAIGGIQAENVLQLKQVHPDGIACVSAIWKKGQAEENARQMRALADEVCR